MRMSLFNVIPDKINISSVFHKGSFVRFELGDLSYTEEATEKTSDSGPPGQFSILSWGVWKIEAGTSTYRSKSAVAHINSFIGKNVLTIGCETDPRELTISVDGYVFRSVSRALQSHWFLIDRRFMPSVMYSYFFGTLKKIGEQPDTKLSLCA